MENHKKLMIVESFLFIALIFIGSFGFWNKVVMNDCMATYKSVWRCIDVSLFGGHPEYSLVIFALFLSILPLIFLKESVYKAWAKFAVVAIPLLLLFILSSPETSGGLFGSTSLFTRETAAMNGSLIFLILSYIIIAVQAWRTRKQ